MKPFCLLALLLSQLLTVTAAFATATVKFANPVVYNSGGNGTNFVVAADLNGDGFPDMIVANADGVSVALNNGDGTFAAPVIYGTGGQTAFAVAVGDVNGDGVPDLVVTNMCLDPACTNGGIGVLIGNGDGTFQPAVGYDAGGPGTEAVVIGDVNNDGAPDVIVTSNCQVLTCVTGSIRVLLNDGHGVFTVTANPISPSQGGPLAIGDLNGDGNLDLVADVGVLLGHGDGTFTAVPAVTIPGGTISIALADVNGDHKLDVIVATQVAVKVLLGNGDGTLQPPVSYKPGGARPLSVAVGDFNGDGKLDLAVANECSSIVGTACASMGSVGVLAGNGDGTFQPPVIYVSGGDLATSVAVADANGDTKADIFVSNVCLSTTNCANGSVGVLLNIFKAAVTVKVVSSLNPALINQPFGVTATITSPVPIPDGSQVDFFSGINPLGSGTTAGGVASATGLMFAGFGPHVITAKYAGDAFHNAGSGTVTETVLRFPTTIVLTSNLNPSMVGQKVTFTATVTSTGPSVPTGTVQFKNGATSMGTAGLSGGVVKFSTTTLPSGTLSITANYLGDTQSAPSSSAPYMQTVQ